MVFAPVCRTIAIPPSVLLPPQPSRGLRPLNNPQHLHRTAISDFLLSLSLRKINSLVPRSNKFSSDRYRANKKSGRSESASLRVPADSELLRYKLYSQRQYQRHNTNRQADPLWDSCPQLEAFALPALVRLTNTKRQLHRLTRMGSQQVQPMGTAVHCHLPGLHINAAGEISLIEADRFLNRVCSDQPGLV